MTLNDIAISYHSTSVCMGLEMELIFLPQNLGKAQYWSSMRKLSFLLLSVVSVLWLKRKLIQVCELRNFQKSHINVNSVLVKSEAYFGLRKRKTSQVELVHIKPCFIRLEFIDFNL